MTYLEFIEKIDRNEGWESHNERALAMLDGEEAEQELEELQERLEDLEIFKEDALVVIENLLAVLEQNRDEKFTINTIQMAHEVLKDGEK